MFRKLLGGKETQSLSFASAQPVSTPPCSSVLQAAVTPRGKAIGLGDAGGQQPLLTWKGFRKVSSMANRPYSVNSWGEMQGKEDCQLPGPQAGQRLVRVLRAEGAAVGNHHAKPLGEKNQSRVFGCQICEKMAPIHCLLLLSNFTCERGLLEPCSL